MSGVGADGEIERLVRQLNLQQHPEGGFFCELFRGDRQMTFTTKTKHDGPRDVGTCIHYLLKAPNFTSWHQVLSDELFLWHAGGPCKLYLLDNEGNLTHKILGDALKDADHVYQVLVPHDTWYAAELLDDVKYVLFSAVVIPGFEFKDWIQGEREKLLEQFPQHKDVITKLTKK
ncbi:hypothetical protein FSP39_021640 [Pinctada imbricata]|uniref:DUF985 domain-containing protein n=1 Tax=Pinctada imbricata TaxID=66713 RepID=A0AA88XNL4_PINIB|nr:hypothetical protein FSP39_021640 [Pinctada imbricata]